MASTRSKLSHGWTFRQQDSQSEDWLYIQRVPTQVHIDLLAHGKIPDPFEDLNERAVQWVGEKSWIYRTSFETPENHARHRHHDLVFEGLDTFATVFLNGTEILKADNMFVSYRVDVAQHLKPSGANDLEIVFESAFLKGRELVKQHSHEHNFLVRQTDVGRLPTRKAQYNWGWDWGPILMTAGPWKPVFLDSYNVRVQDVWARYELSNDLAHCSGSIVVDVAGNLAPEDEIHLGIYNGDTTVFETKVSSGKAGAIEAPFTIDKPNLWYPLGYGAPSRHLLKATVLRKDQGGAAAASLSKSIGFRRAELAQEADAHGKSFYFRINNIDVFCGGACWIPTDSFQAQIPEKRLRDWVALMAESNQVMLRIWGGGVYEHDALLDACDELGIMILHDFQFACGSYPAYDAFLQTFEVEARQNIRRLRTHPSVVAWAGNNEDYQVQEKYKLEYDYENKDPAAWRTSSFPARYIYEHLIPQILSEEDPHVIYHPSSPWGDGKHTTDPTVGDIHQWNLWHGAMHKYQEVDLLGGRFVSEFGMEAFPHLDTLHRMVTDPDQRFPGSMAMDAHNKAIGHERRMMAYVVDNFRLPPAFSLAAYAHLTQMVQAETMRYAYKIWRRDWQGRKCGGVLVWQLNDCWPTISWAVVDYYLVRKPAFYAIARALQPLDVTVMRKMVDWTQTGDWVDENSALKTGQVDQTLHAKEGVFDVWIASSKIEPVDGQVQLRFISIATGQEIREGITQSITAAPNTTTTVLDQQMAPAAIPDSDDPTKPFDMSAYDPYVMHAVLKVGDQVVASDVAWPEPIKFLDLSKRDITFDVTSSSRVTIRVVKPVKGFVFEEKPDVKLDDNGFDLVPGADKVVTVEGMDAKDLKYTFVGATGASLSVSDD
ncbi:glycoside hydrolase family 2 protein [Emericellopsis atlantica]|uniref:Beta-mannosidase B n=1 Tax=Emericellopsis atlantica TaxID=2614577 RepID=A0A9P8CRZ0_9HYPO|nr:glycoside hydrolase family 2 protein [Emericellopsis atlantica]KAG9257293.1 glycoside hydrolase family 2 protein [Emericellopsis atlantica]